MRSYVRRPEHEIFSILFGGVGGAAGILRVRLRTHSRRWGATLDVPNTRHFSILFGGYSSVNYAWGYGCKAKFWSSTTLLYNEAGVSLLASDLRSNYKIKKELHAGKIMNEHWTWKEDINTVNEEMSSVLVLLKHWHCLAFQFVSR